MEIFSLIALIWAVLGWVIGAIFVVQLILVGKRTRYSASALLQAISPINSQWETLVRPEDRELFRRTRSWMKVYLVYAIVTACVGTFIWMNKDQVIQAIARYQAPR